MSLCPTSNIHTRLHTQIFCFMSAAHWSRRHLTTNILTSTSLLPLTKSLKAAVTCSLVFVFLKSLFTVPSSFYEAEETTYIIYSHIQYWHLMTCANYLQWHRWWKFICTYALVAVAVQISIRHIGISASWMIQSGINELPLICWLPGNKVLFGAKTYFSLHGSALRTAPHTHLMTTHSHT